MMAYEPVARARIRGLRHAVLCLGMAAFLLLLVDPGIGATDESGIRLDLDPAVTAIDLAPYATVLVDPDQAWTIGDIEPQAFRSAATAPGDLNFGYSTAAHWLQLRVFVPGEPGAPPVERILELGYPSLDGVELYVAGRDAPMRAGDRLPFSERVIPHRNFVFPVALHPGEVNTLTLRIVSEGSLTVPLTLWAPEAFEHHNQTLYIVLGVYFGSLLAMLLYNLLLYGSIRQRSYLEYAGMLGGMIVGQLSLYGFGNQFLWSGGGLWGHIAIVVGFALSGMFSAMFARSFLDTRRHSPRMDRILLGFAGLFGVLAAGVLVAPYSYFAIALTASGIVFAGVAIASGLVCAHGRAPGARLYLLAWSAVLLGTAILGLRHHALIPTNLFTSYAMLVGSALEMLLLSFALADRINTMRRERTQAQEAALLANEKLVDALHRSEQMLEKKVAERTQELEAANRMLEENERRLRHAAHHDALTGLANRLLLDDRIRQGIVRARRHHSRMAVLLADLNGFKPVNDRYGHAAGDELLVEVGRRLQHIVRAGDTVARLGGDEFVILLEDLYDDVHIRRVIAAIVDCFAQPFPVGEDWLSLHAAIGCAVFPRDGDSPAALLKEADAAMYRIKALHRVRTDAGAIDPASEVDTIMKYLEEARAKEDVPDLKAAARA